MYAGVEYTLTNYYVMIKLLCFEFIWVIAMYVDSKTQPYRREEFFSPKGAKGHGRVRA